MLIGQEVVDAVAIARAGTAHHAMHFVAFFEQHLGKV